MHQVTPLKVHYYGTNVVLLGTRNEDGTPNIAPMSSSWFLGDTGMLGLGDTSQTSANLRREREVVLNMVPSHLAPAVDRLALTTAGPVLSASRLEKGYRTERDKFGTAGLTEQTADLVRAPRIAECPIQLECRVVAIHPMPTVSCAAFQVEVLRAHVDEALVIPGTHYVDPVGWDPLIMKFCDLFGAAEPLQASRLAAGWRMPNRVGAGNIPAA
jgi:flavin reductase (DIM6/NTAB) family NADH-FMN oxidoreductase RutF